MAKWIRYLVPAATNMEFIEQNRHPSNMNYDNFETRVALFYWGKTGPPFRSEQPSAWDPPRQAEGVKSLKPTASKLI